MSKPIFKVVDNKGRVLIPQELRALSGIERGGIVSMVVDRGRIAVKKAIVVDGDDMPMEAKECYVQSAVREFSGKALADLLEVIARLIQAQGGDGSPAN